MRFAVYFTPPKTHELTRTGARWLGRDAFSGEIVGQPRFPDIEPTEFETATAFPRRYGFHGTIVAPFRPQPGVTQEKLARELRQFASEQEAFPLSGMAPAPLSNFIALQAPEAREKLGKLAAAAVERFNEFRAPLGEEEIAKRKPEKLSDNQLALLKRWGYPYVMEEFRFHMTLVGPLKDSARTRFLAAARSHFDETLAHPVEFGGLALFVESGPGADFTVAEFFELQPSRG